MTHRSEAGDHPDPILLERFMRNELSAAERRRIVRHLIAGCSRCVAVTSRFWSLGDPPAGAATGAEAATERRRKTTLGWQPRPAAGGAAAYGDLFERLADVGRRIEEERELAPRLAAELLADPPTVRAAGIKPAFLTPAVCEVLLDRSRHAAAGEPAAALQAADLALAIAERLDPAACGATVVAGLRVRAWAHVAQARRLGDDLDGAEWALAVAEALASGFAGGAGRTGAAARVPSAGAACAAGAAGAASAASSPDGRAGAGTAAPPLEPAEWAELLAFKAGLFADRGDLRGADRLLGRAAELFQAGADPQRAGRALVQEGWIRAELGDRQRAAELLRAGVDLLDPAADPALVAANLVRLASLLRGIAMAATTALDTAALAEAATTLPVPFAAHACGLEALQLVVRARALYRELGDAAAEARLWRLQGQIEAALGRLEAAEGTLLTATAALARHGFGREAALAQIELAQVLLRQGRTAEICRLERDIRPVKQARDKSWPLAAALLVFQVTAQEPAHLAHPDEIKLLGELERFLAPRTPQIPPQPLDRHHRLERVA